MIRSRQLIYSGAVAAWGPSVWSGRSPADGPPGYEDVARQTWRHTAEPLSSSAAVQRELFQVNGHFFPFRGVAKLPDVGTARCGFSGGDAHSRADSAFSADQYPHRRDATLGRQWRVLPEDSDQCAVSAATHHPRPEAWAKKGQYHE